MSEKDKLHSCELYLPMGEEIMSEQLQCLNKLYDFNATRPTELDKRTALLKEMLAEIGENCYIEPPFLQTGEANTYIWVKTYTPTSI